ncbi:MAG TPA: pyridoxamine 5'-phosphate oxidase family protein [Candidatus Limnocylindrales bacterium]|nr:pyridoxamine 5'-phosphate oxidase family protein [Candidatus Limnocylindrales bacterium]
MISPKETKNLDIYGQPPLEWERVIEALNKTGDLEVADAASRFWIATTRPDGGPHVMAVGIVWDDGKFYLSTGAGTQKGKNLARDPRCMVSVAALGIDVVAEGEAKIIRDDAELQRIAALYSDWGPHVRDGAFWHEFSAPSAGPPPWDVYEITPTTVYAVATAEPNGATRWRL